MGCPVTGCKVLAADVLLRSDLKGYRLSWRSPSERLCTPLGKEKRINASQNVRIVHETATTATVDGDAGLGLVVAPFAMQVAIEKAKVYGSGWVSVRNSNHFGIAGYHALMAVEQDMIGISMTNASPLVAPTYSSERSARHQPDVLCFSQLGNILLW
jgi:LDH2 family malate/lactate/ureidoglycolate dehydrogenase